MANRTQWERFVRLASAECLLTGRANSSGVIVARSIWIATWAFAFAVLLDEKTAAGAGWAVCLSCYPRVISNHLALFGALFAGVYASLYARFSSQWTYLAGVYNQIMSTQAQSPNDGKNDERARVYANWMAGFIEDADDLHLALKPMYAAVIVSMIRDDQVRQAFVANTHDGRARLERLERSVRQVLESSALPLPRTISAQSPEPPER